MGKSFAHEVINRAPTIRVLSPNRGETLSGSFLIEWTGGDLDGDDLNFTIAYNLDNTGWHLLAAGYSGFSYLWDTTKVPNKFSIMLRITVNDGFGGETFDECDYSFSIENQSPPTGPDPWILGGGVAAVGASLSIGVLGYKRRRNRPSRVVDPAL